MTNLFTFSVSVFCLLFVVTLVGDCAVVCKFQRIFEAVYNLDLTANCPCLPWTLADVAGRRVCRLPSLPPPQRLD